MLNTISRLKVTLPSVFGSVQECGLTTACDTHPLSCAKGPGGNSPKIHLLVRSRGCCRPLPRLVREPPQGCHQALCKRAPRAWGDGCWFLPGYQSRCAEGPCGFRKEDGSELSVGDGRKGSSAILNYIFIISVVLHNCPCTFFIFPWQKPIKRLSWGNLQYPDVPNATLVGF